ncbi:E3 ubiquitin-protein ligase MPSR1-like [Ziziphus jujuba]|uniref:E3 ubiquitin-protein ligase MPSR1-like n=1 Tax=Ziziphus jujuba TaxID=326968 RepID=A0ABM4AFM3_ZIZJJ|nr:E3 ubiquitin-protein ligase MPSR1-like [Ziziphus jujuba]
MSINLAVSLSRPLSLPLTGGLLNVSLNHALIRDLRTREGFVVPVSSYPLASQLHTSLFLPNRLLQHPPFCHIYIHNFLSQAYGFPLPHSVTDRLASHVLAASLVRTGPFYLNAEVDLVLGSSELVFDHHLISNGNIGHGDDDHHNFHFIDDQLIIDQTTRRLPSSSGSMGTRTRRTRITQTRAADRLRMTTHERVVAENVELGGCCICLEDFSAGTELLRFGCEHLYHKNCIVKWLENQNSCPLCRRPL